MLVLACVDPIQILLMLGIMFIGGPMLFAASLIPYRKAVKALARSKTHHSPAVLFGATLGLTLLWAGVLAMIVAIFANNLDNDGYAVLLCGLFGSVMLLSVLLTQLDQPEKHEFPVGSRNVQPQRGPFQIWAQDLFIALLCYGAGLAILSKVIGPDTRHMDDFVRWAMYVLLAGTIGLLFAVDFCRRQEWTQLPQKRAMIFVSVFTIFPLILPLAVMAWWRWRRALSLQAKIVHAASDSRAETAL